MRDIAIGLISDGTLKGYLAYEGEKVVGWLNAQDKKNYAKIRESAELWEPGANETAMAVTCFIVAPDARRMGVATALLARAVEDAAREGYDYVEAYPASGELDCFQHYHGHPEMYEKCGFALHKAFEGHCVYRRALR
jgi:GNAT superfamily N-acetyltransferase